MSGTKGYRTHGSHGGRSAHANSGATASREPKRGNDFGAGIG